MMANSTLPINSSRIKICEYENCKNEFIRRSNNHKYCKEHEKINNRKERKKSKKRKMKDESDTDNVDSFEIEDDKNGLKKVKKESNETKAIKKENNDSTSSSEQNTPTSSSKKSNLLDILMKRTSSEPYNCIGKNKPTHINIPQKVDKCIQTDDLFEFVPKKKKVMVDESVGTDNEFVFEPSPLIDVIPTPQYSYILETPTKNIQSVNLPLSNKRYIKNNSEYPLRDISNIVNYKYLQSPISNRKSPKYLSKTIKLTDLENKSKENLNFDISPIKKELSPSLRNDNIPFLSTGIFEEEISYYDDKDKDLFGQSITMNNLNSSSSSSASLNYEFNNPYSIPIDYYMEYIKILKKISKYSSSQELKQTLSSNSDLTSISDQVLSPAKTDAEDLLNWLNIE